MNLYEYKKTDEYGYLRHVEVRPGVSSGGLVVDTDPCGHSLAAVLPVNEVRKLHEVLGQWLDAKDVTGETASGQEATSAPPTPADVRAIVKEELDKLISSPMMVLPPRPPAPSSSLEQSIVEHLPENLWGTLCMECGHVSGLHLNQGCGFDPCSCKRSPQRCGDFG